jgi:hypothetical protein
MPKESPDHRDAELMVRVYDLRREAVMREARAAIAADFWPRSYDDVLAVMKPDHHLNTAFRQTTSYWEMVYGFARHGIVAPDFWIENNSEGLFILAKVEPFIEQLRTEYAPTCLRNSEWIATGCEEGRRIYALVRARVEKLL